MINIILDDVLVKMKEENPTGAWFVDKMTIRNLDVGNCPLVISGIKVDLFYFSDQILELLFY